MLDSPLCLGKAAELLAKDEASNDELAGLSATTLFRSESFLRRRGIAMEDDMSGSSSA
jgi:predicted HTH domain antitoxin